MSHLANKNRKNSERNENLDHQCQHIYLSISRGKSTIKRFSSDTSRFLLPTFRRPNYSQLKREKVTDQEEKETFHRWTKEDGQYYRIINSALLNDDPNVLKHEYSFINNLRTAIKNSNHQAAMKLYRGFAMPRGLVKQEYTIGSHFLWPTFTSTSKNKDIAHR